jgi:hypothetical protein
VTALPPPGVVPGASLEVLLATLHLLRSQAALFVGYLDVTGAQDQLSGYIRSRCEEVMLDVDLHLSTLSPGVGP